MVTKDLEGSWKATKWGFSGQVVFVISETKPLVMASADGRTGVFISCVWDVEGNQLSLSVPGLRNTFTWEINAEGQLVLSNPIETNILAGYILWGPFEKAEGNHQTKL